MLIDSVKRAAPALLASYQPMKKSIVRVPSFELFVGQNPIDRGQRLHEDSVSFYGTLATKKDYYTLAPRNDSHSSRSIVGLSRNLYKSGTVALTLFKYEHRVEESHC